MKSHKSNPNHPKLKTERMVEELELPKDLFLGMPLLPMEGNRTLCITNHRGIIRYSHETIVVASRSYGIEVTGRELMIHVLHRIFLKLPVIWKAFGSCYDSMVLPVRKRMA